MVADGDFEVGFHGEYREIVPNERLVSTEAYEGIPDADAHAALEHPDAHRDRRKDDRHDSRRAPDQGRAGHAHRVRHGGRPAGRAGPPGADRGLASLSRSLRHGPPGSIPVVRAVGERSGQVCSGFVRESQNVLVSRRRGHASSVLLDLAKLLLMILTVVWVVQVAAFMIAVLLYRRTPRNATEPNETRAERSGTRRRSRVRRGDRPRETTNALALARRVSGSTFRPVMTSTNGPTPRDPASSAQQRVRLPRTARRRLRRRGTRPEPP